MMRVLLYLSLLLLCLPSIMCAQKISQPSIDNATVAQDPFTWDFGRVKAGIALEHDFVLKNDSKRVLRVQNISTSCGCTVSEVAKKTLAPGESTTIKVKFDSLGYYGETQQFVYVTTDNLDKPILRYIIKAYVEK
jgi:hypothetical protein